jgi:hypothetical protein
MSGPPASGGDPIAQSRVWRAELLAHLAQIRAATERIESLLEVEEAEEGGAADGG